MSFTQAAKMSTLIQTVSNYSIADDISFQPPPASPQNARPFHYDERFWADFIHDPGAFWDKKIDLTNFILSDWIARIPGLYWLQGYRGLHPVLESSDVEYRSSLGNRVVYRPAIKSAHVMNGIGTFILPPDDDGKRIMSISSDSTPTSGVPVLVFPEVLEAYDLKPGDALSIKSAYWRKMSLEWQNKFDAVSQIQRGYLVVSNPDQVEKISSGRPVEIHPFSIMEYHSNGALLYDYVYCTTDTGVKNYRKEVEKFFKEYSQRNDRYGRYLIAADATAPLFEADYNTPAELRRLEPGGKAQLDLLVARMRDSFYHNSETIESIMGKIPLFYPTAREINALAVQAGVSPSELRSDTAKKMSAQLVSLCLDRKLLESLVDIITAANRSSIDP